MVIISSSSLTARRPANLSREDLGAGNAARHQGDTEILLTNVLYRRKPARVCVSCASIEGEDLDPSFTAVAEMVEFEAVEASGEVHQFSLHGQGVMTVFCNECGSQVAEGSKFCLKCGSSLPTAAQQTVRVATPVQPPPSQPVQQSPTNEEVKKKGGGFLASGAGVALIVILGLMLVVGVTFGIIFLVKGNSNNTADAETVKAWNEYDSIATSDSTNFTTIKLDSASLTKAQEDLKKSQEKVVALEKTLKETGGTATRRQGAKNTNTRDIKADQMAATLAAYNAYVTKMNELYTTLVGANLLDPNVVNTFNNILAELQTLSTKVKTASNDFLANNTKVVTGTFNPTILTTPKTIATEVQKNVTAAQTAEQQRLAGDKAAADQAAAAAAAEAARQKAAADQQTQANLFMCPNCNGTGMTPGGTCGVCNGTGQVTYQTLINNGWYESDDGWMPPDSNY